MGKQSRGLKTVVQLAGAYARSVAKVGARLSMKLGPDRAKYESEVLGCIWFAAHLDALDDADLISRLRDHLERNWELLELQCRFDDAIPVDGEFCGVAIRGDALAIQRDVAAKFAGQRPALAAHELLLQAGDQDRRSRRGVFTTPCVLADFLVKRADVMLREEFQLQLGIADLATWNEVSDRNGISIPEGVEGEQRFVRILDGATGSGLFPLAIARLARSTWLEHWRGAGVSSRTAEQRWETEAGPELASRVVCHEIMPVTRAIARWHLSEVFGDLPPAIEAANPLEEFDSLPFPITVSIGNPPYSVRSGSLESASRELIEPYRFESGSRIVEKGALRLEMHLQDDYVKFMRLAELQIERAGVGVMSLVTNHSFLDSPSLRGLRNCLTKRFDRIELLNLHGSRTRKTEEHKRAGDQNVFAIGQGVATIVASSSSKRTDTVRYADLIGPKAEKLERLAASRNSTEPGSPLEPTAPNWYFVPRETRYSAIYDKWVSLKDLFHSSVSGIVTAHDHLVVGFDDEALREHGEHLLDRTLSIDELRSKLNVRDNAGWKLERARDRFRDDPNRDTYYRDYAYRPFDTRRLLYHSSLVWCDRRRVMSALDGKQNTALAVCRQLAAPPWNHVFATRELIDDNLVSNRSRERTHCFPLYRRLNPGDTTSPLVSNLNRVAVEAIAPKGLKPSPEDLLHCVYAILHSPEYRNRHQDSLAVDFPRIPSITDTALFQRLIDCGRALLQAHLQFTSTPTTIALTSDGVGSAVVERGYPKLRSERVFLNEHYSIGPVSESQWNYAIGAYAPCRKWLKDRVNRSLSATDLATYERVVNGVEASLQALSNLPELPLEAPRTAFTPA